MATSQSYLDFVCEQLDGIGAIRPFRMMGEGMVYVDEKPVVLICDDTVFIKKISALDKFEIKESGIPYKGASERYIIDPEDTERFREIIKVLADNTPLKIKNKKVGVK